MRRVVLTMWVVLGMCQVARAEEPAMTEAAPEVAFSGEAGERDRSAVVSESEIPQSAPTILWEDAAAGRTRSLDETAVLADPEAPFYRRWVESLFELVAPGEPYRRDRAVFSLGTAIGYDDNVLYSATNKISSATYGVNGAIEYRVGTRRLELDAKLSGAINYYENRPGGSDDQNYALTLGMMYRVTPRLGLSVETYTAYLSQPSPQLVGGIFQFTGSYFYTNTNLSVTYQLRPRLGISLGYAFSGFKYDDELINEQSGFFQQNFSISGNWLFNPRTTLILQYRYNPVTYYESGLGSTGQLLLVGIQQAISPRLDYQLMFGAEHRQLENPNPGSARTYLGPFVEGGLNYKFAPRSTIVGSMRLGTEPAGVSGVTIRQTFRTSLGISHSIGSRLTLGGNLGFERDYYDQSGVADYTQDIYSASFSIRYQFALFTSVVLRDDYLMFESSLPDGSYTRNFISLGLELTF